MSLTRDQIASLASSPAHEARLLSRHNLVDTTTGLAGDYVQANLVVLPSAYADDFRVLCARNPVPCPILGATPVGDPKRIIPDRCISSDNSDFDLRTDFPRYNVFRTVDDEEGDQESVGDNDEAVRDGHAKTNGAHQRKTMKKKQVIVEEKRDLLEDWTDDHIGFLIGCSFTFEQAISQHGLRLCHQEDNKVVAMYQTSIPLLPAGIFHGSTFVVSMRTFRPEEVEKVRNISRPYLASHGEPVAWGWEGARSIGVEDIGDVSYGDAQTIQEGEIPVFWGCGVTPQFAVEKALERDAIQGMVMSHKPGHMLVTDWKVEDFLRHAREQLGLSK